MAVRMIDRLAILFAAVILVALGLLAGLFALGWQPFYFVDAVSSFLIAHRIEAALVGIVLLLCGWHLVFQSVSQPKERGIVRDTSLGSVHIQFRALENLVTRTAQDVRGVRDVEASVRPYGEGVGIEVSVNVLPEFKIPELSDEVQERVEQAVRETAGLLVTDVSVDVRNVVGQPKARVE